MESSTLKAGHFNWFLDPLKFIVGWNDARFQVLSPLRRDECVRRLRETSNHPFRSIFSREELRQPVYGFVGERHVRLWKNGKVTHALRPLLAATLEDHENGTRLKCRTGFYSINRIFLIIWVGLLCLVFYNWYSQSRPEQFSFVMPAVILAFLWTAISVGVYASRNDAADIKVHLLMVLDGQVEE
jgi:hypothetical protein